MSSAYLEQFCENNILDSTAKDHSQIVGFGQLCHVVWLIDEFGAAKIEFSPGGGTFEARELNYVYGIIYRIPD